MPASFVVAVSFSKPFAAAVVYDVSREEPLFQYDTPRGQASRAFLSEPPSKLPVKFLPWVTHQVRGAALGYAIVGGPHARTHDERLGVMQAAIGRAMERARHNHESFFRGVGPEDFVVYVADSGPVPLDFVGTVARELKQHDWRIAATQVLIKSEKVRANG
jgi:hypothetical protein